MFDCLFVYVCATGRMWKSEDSWWESVFSSHCVGIRNQTEIGMFEGEHLYLPSHLIFMMTGLSFTAYGLLSFSTHQFLVCAVETAALVPGYHRGSKG